MQSDQLKSNLKRIVLTFPPELYPEIKDGGSYYIVLETMLRLESKTIPLTQGNISQQIKQNEFSKNKLAAIDNIMPLTRKLELNELLTPEGKDIYKFPENIPRALGEFLGTIPYKRKGRVGFVRHMRNSIGRLILWYALCHPNSIEPEDVKKQLLKIIKGKNDQAKKKKVESVEKYLNRFIAERNGYFRFDAEKRIFKLANEQKVFDKLYLEYESFIAPRPTLREPILSLVWQHERVSGRLMVQELEELGFTFDPSSIYRQMKCLIHDGVLDETKIPQRGRKTGQGVENFHRVKFSNQLDHNETICKEISDTIKLYRFKANEKFLETFLWYAETLKPNALEVFFRELRWGFLLRDEDQTASINLWLSFIEEMQKDKSLLNKLRSAAIEKKPNEELAARLDLISQEKRISSLAVVLMYFSVNSCLTGAN